MRPRGKLVLKKSVRVATAEGVTSRTRPKAKPHDYEMAQRNFLFDEITKYFRKKFATIEGFSIRPINVNQDARKRFNIPESEKNTTRMPKFGPNMEQIPSDDDTANSCKYFQLCRREQCALLIEVSVDSSSCKSDVCKSEVQPSCHCIGRVKLTIFSLNLNLLDSSDCYDYNRGKIFNIKKIFKKFFKNFKKIQKQLFNKNFEINTVCSRGWSSAVLVGKWSCSPWRNQVYLLSP